MSKTSIVVFVVIVILALIICGVLSQGFTRSIDGAFILLDNCPVIYNTIELEGEHTIIFVNLLDLMGDYDIALCTNSDVVYTIDDVEYILPAGTDITQYMLLTETKFKLSIDIRDFKLVEVISDITEANSSMICVDAESILVDLCYSKDDVLLSYSLSIPSYGDYKPVEGITIDTEVLLF